MSTSARWSVLAGITLLLMVSSSALGYLHSSHGRFMQRDPLGYVDGMNSYEPCQSNTIVGADPLGLHKISWDLVFRRYWDFFGYDMGTIFEASIRMGVEFTSAQQGVCLAFERIASFKEKPTSSDGKHWLAPVSWWRDQLTIDFGDGQDHSLDPNSPLLNPQGDVTAKLRKLLDALANTDIGRSDASIVDEGKTVRNGQCMEWNDVRFNVFLWRPERLLAMANALAGLDGKRIKTDVTIDGVKINFQGVTSKVEKASARTFRVYADGSSDEKARR